ncbi:MAG: endonuclease [Prevotella sp.]
MSVVLFLFSFLTFVELNCENLFDCRHDSLRNDTEFLPSSLRHWSETRYWRKLNNISKAIISSGGDSLDAPLPDFVALCEVENDTVLTDLTRRSLLRNARYDYLMTDSPDERGIDVALLYSPFSFFPLTHYGIRVESDVVRRPTRDILYVKGLIMTSDTLHIFVIHSPSRYGGERFSRSARMAVAGRLASSIDSLRRFSPEANIIVAGDFNDYTGDAPLEYLCNKASLTDVTRHAKGRDKAKGTYRYKGKWGSLDHVLFSAPMVPLLMDAYVNDASFLVEDDDKYGSVKPLRSYTGYRFSYKGTSDHLPLVVRFAMP